MSGFVHVERHAGGGAGVRRHALHLEELLTCNTTGDTTEHVTALVVLRAVSQCVERKRHQTS